MPNEEGVLTKILRDEFRILHKHVQDLSIGMARLEERVLRTNEIVEDVAALRSRVDRVDRRLVKVSGEHGDNGQVSQLERKVATNTEKLESLLMSRAAIAGYGLAAGGSAAALLKLFM